MPIRQAASFPFLRVPKGFWETAIGNRFRESGTRNAAFDAIGEAQSSPQVRLWEQPLARSLVFREHVRMRLRMPFIVILGLAACTSKPVYVTAGQCWSVTAGDKIQGTAILYIASPFTFHVGPKVGGGPNCRHYSIKFASNAVGKVYDDITDRKMPADPGGGPREGLITLSGDVVDGDDRRDPIIQINDIQLAKTVKP